MEPNARAIDAHDRQRQLPEPALRSLIGQLTDRLRPHQPCLDAGAGSGMITVPLARAGIAITALDHSPAMLARLEARAAGLSNLSIVHGDMTALPFVDEAFGGVLVANVFHFITAWEQALTETVRVLRRNGRLLVNLGGDSPLPDELARLTELFFRELEGATDFSKPSIGPESVYAFEGAVQSHGLAPESPVSVAYEDLLTPESVIDRLEHNMFARPGTARETQIASAAQASRNWARMALGSLDRSFPHTRHIVYRVYAP